MNRSNKVSYYIQGLGHISSQKTYDNTNFLKELMTYEDNFMPAVVPDFKQYINPVLIRRLSQSLRIGLSAAKLCTIDAMLDKPDAIITASGYGCIGDTHRFMHEIIDHGEKQLTPTFFMQSTYNALSGLIAMTMHCNNYNSTYAHRGFAFETALQDAMMQLTDAPEKRMIVGSYDEANYEQFTISQRSGINRKEPVHNLSLFETTGTGTLQGESAAFFALGTHVTATTYCQIKAVKMLYAPDSSAEIQQGIEAFLHENAFSVADLDLVLNGIGGDEQDDSKSKALASDYFAAIPQGLFKHLSGDYSTASSFGVWLAAMIFRHGTVPTVVSATDTLRHAPIKNILVFNHFWGKCYSFILLAATDE